ncbi:uroporphyrinogen-III synthase [Thiorhodovibrio frisius]|uniref:Uroporphyrinogen-III synthase n=1 Tax=Thiorhodovibrio frisius TaxID=631362 RepID=H8Z6C1_9GAMM|nr:uroporphyrinogen-III synthase [Thiorhodovibrio frisius]EIC20705.1 uroporphyrinogen-III synthase [Thiorhodovibrio frisius]WPL21453.1 Uroporphyrinogen-III synthase [Thiorhodovibrio frisius]
MTNPTRNPKPSGNLPDDIPCDLKGQTILVTRPVEQAPHLCDLIQQANGEALLFPTVSIRPSTHAEKAKARMAEPWDLLIFISRNAVNFALKLLPGSQLPPPPPAGPMIAAVGAATAAALGDAGRPPDLIPSAHFDSEGLLELPELTHVRGRRILIVRGEGGRPMLGDTLAQREAEIVYAEVYCRGLPEQDATEQLPRWHETLNLLTATSDEVLNNLHRLVPESEHPWLRSLPLAVYSNRTAARAMELGFRTVAVASESSDPALLDALCRLVQRAPR